VGVDGESRTLIGRWAVSSVVEAGAALGGSAAIMTLPAVLASVPPVLDSIVTAAMQTSCNLCPPLANLVNEDFYLGTFFRRDGLVV